MSLNSRGSVLGKAGLGLGFFLCPWPRALCLRLHLCCLVSNLWLLSVCLIMVHFLKGLHIAGKLLMHPCAPSGSGEPLAFLVHPRVYRAHRLSTAVGFFKCCVTREIELPSVVCILLTFNLEMRRLLVRNFTISLSSFYHSKLQALFLSTSARDLYLCPF